MIKNARTYLSGSIACLAILVLSGCGFHPLMADYPDSSAAEDLARVRVAVIADRSGQILRNHLIDDLTRASRSQPSQYTLHVTLTEPRQEIAIRRDETASRVAYTANATFLLRDATGFALFTGTSSSSSTYEAANSEFASIAGQRSARDRAMQEISADIRQQLAAYFFRARRTPEP